MLDNIFGKYLENTIPYKSAEVTIAQQGIDQLIWNITPHRKFRLWSVKIVNPDQAQVVTVQIKDGTGAGIVKDTLTVPASTTWVLGESEVKGIEFEDDAIYVNANIAGAIIRIGGGEY